MTTNGGKLAKPVQIFIVQQLACFDTPKSVAEAAGREFGVVVSRQLVETYDPNKRAFGAGPWAVALFEETRKAFLEDTAKIGISHRAVRLRSLERMAAKAEADGNHRLAGDLLRQAAEDVGGVYTNQRRLSDADGKPLIPPGAVTIFALPDNGRGSVATDRDRNDEG